MYAGDLDVGSTISHTMRGRRQSGGDIVGYRGIGRARRRGRCVSRGGYSIARMMGLIQVRRDGIHFGVVAGVDLSVQLAGNA